MNLTTSDLEQLPDGTFRLKKRVSSTCVPKSGEKGKEAAKTLLSAQKKPEGLQRILQVLKNRGISYVTEHRFLKSRMFRFDVAVPQFNLYIEYEGLVATGKKGGHQTRKGYTDNCSKYNLAAVNGWTGLRYTALNYKYFESDLIEFLTNYKTPKNK